MLYAIGRGVPVDPEKTYAWLTLAADRGDMEAMQIRTDIAHRMKENEFRHVLNVT